jgi:hypothetical protein
MKRTKIRPQRKNQKVTKEVVTVIDPKRSTKSPIYRALKPVVTDGITDLGNLIRPGLGTLGGLVTKKAMDWFGKVTGFGDYTIRNNSLISNPTGGPPSFGGTGSRKVVKEFVKFVECWSDGSFHIVDRFFLNPSNPVLFPKLSIEAQLWQMYKMHGCIVYLESACSESITTVGGNMSVPTFLVCSKYNLKEKSFVNESQMMNSFFCSDKRVNKDLYHPIECDPSQQQVDKLYTWANTPQPGFTRDPNLENMCEISIASVGGYHTNRFKAYKMYIECDIEFFKPIYNTQPELNDHYQLATPVSGDMLSGSTLTDTSTTSGDPQKSYTVSGNVITFDSGVYGNFEMELSAQYSTPTVSGGGLPTFSSTITPLNIYSNDTTYIRTNGGDITQDFIMKFAFAVNGGGTVTISDVVPAAWTSGDFFIQSLSHLSN